jgi:hypothetical protein
MCCILPEKSIPKGFSLITKQSSFSRFLLYQFLPCRRSPEGVT